MEIEDTSLEEWLSILKPYQSVPMLYMANEFGPEDAAKRWLAANGPGSTVGFGGSGNPEPFFDRFMEEFKKFICGDVIYEEHRNQLIKESGVTKTIYVSIISAALGATLGYTATLLAPAVAIMLHAVGTMGLKAWCAG